jgi:hypothetical protein
MSNRAFAAAAKIKSDIVKRNIEPPEIDKRGLRYFDFNSKYIKTVSGDVYNIDLKSAYAHVLFNKGIASPDTFAYLSKIDKIDRLAACGMLASVKYIFEHNEHDEIIRHEIAENPLHPYFYICVKEVGVIMRKLIELIGRGYLMYWVDGIYFDNLRNIDKVTDYLKSIHYPHSFEILKDFTANDKYVSYIKDGKLKQINVPKPNSEVNRFLIDYLGVFK